MLNIIVGILGLLSQLILITALDGSFITYILQKRKQALERLN